MPLCLGDLPGTRLLLTSALLTSVCLQLQVPEGCARYTVELSRPLGLVLEEKGSQIFVGEVQPGGLAARDGTIQPGDILISTSGITYSKEADYGGAKVRMGEARVTLNVTGEVCFNVQTISPVHSFVVLNLFIQPVCMHTWGYG